MKPRHTEVLAQGRSDNQPPLARLLDEYLSVKDEYKKLHKRFGYRASLKRRYQALERKIIPQIPIEYRYRDRVLIKGYNEFAEHIQVFTTRSLQRRMNHREVLTHSDHLQRILRGHD
jgi:hypothetical protein